MPTVAEIKSQYPDLADATDDQVVDTLHEAFYSDLPREQIAAKLGMKTAPPAVEKSGAMRRAADYLLSGAQGAIGIGQSAVGLADLATGGRVGKFLENEGGLIGYRPDDASAALEKMKTPEQQAASKAVADASVGEEGDDQGFMSKVGRVGMAALRNPSVIAHGIVQSLPSQIAGGVVGNAALRMGLSAAERVAIAALPTAEQAAAIAAASPRLAGAAGGIGEGVTTMGSQAEQIRTDENNPDRLLTGTQALLAGGSGAMTGLIGTLTGSLAKKIGLEQSESLLAGVHADPVGSIGKIKGILGATLTEGAQEFIQSAQEQMAQNVATGQDPWKDVGQQAVLGALTGAAQGGGSHALFHNDAHAPATSPPPVAPPLTGAPQSPPTAPTAPPVAPVVGVPPAVVAQATGAPVPAAPLTTAGDLIRQDKQPGSGPLTNALNAGVEVAAQNADAAAPVVDTPHAPRSLSADQFAAIRNLPPEQQEDAVQLGQLGNDPTVVPGVRRHAQSKLDAMLGDVSAPLNPIIDDPKTGEPVLPETPTVAAAKPGNETDQALARAESDLRRTDATAAAQRDADRPPLPTGEPQDGDILNRLDKPFTTMPGAMRALADAGDGHEIVRVARGLVVRKTKTETKEAADGPARTADAGTATDGPAPVAAAPGGTGALAAVEHGGTEAAQPVAAAGEGTVPADPAVRPAGDKPAVAADAGRPTGFTTAKGSKYTINGQTTTRNKAARSDVGHEGDSGPKATSARTIYVDGDAARLSAAGLSNVGEKGSRVVIKDGKATLLSWNEAAGAWGAAPSSRDVAFHDEPAIGRSPLELWNPVDDVPGHEGYQRMHAGNPIVRLDAEKAVADEPIPSARGTPAEGAPAQAAPAEPAPSASDRTEPAGLPAAGSAAVQADGVKPVLAPIALKSEPLRSGETLRARALILLQEAKSRFGGTTVTNESDGVAIHIPASGLKHAVSGSLSPAAVAAVRHVDELVRTAQFTGAEPDRKGRRNVLQARFYDRDATYDGKPVRLRVVVRVAPDGSRYYDHFEARGIEREAEKKDAAAGQPGEPGEPVSIQPFAEASSAESDRESVPPSGLQRQGGGVAVAKDVASPDPATDTNGLGQDTGPHFNRSQDADAFAAEGSPSDPAEHGAPAVGARDVDAPRNRAASAARERDDRLRAKGLFADEGLNRERIGTGDDEVAAEAERRPSVAEEDQALAERIAASWENKPNIKVVNSIDDPQVPQAVRDEDDKQRSLGAGGDPEGVFHDGAVYLFSDQLRGEADVRRVLMHEALGHYGLRGFFGKELGSILDRMAIARPAELEAKAEKYGFDLSEPKERRAAAEELLAELAQTQPQLGWVRQAIAAIRTWIRKHVPGAYAMKISDDEIVRNYILPARGWVQRSGTTAMSRKASSAAATDVPMFSRSLGGQLSEAMNSVRDVNLPAGYKVADLMDSAGKLSIWHKTVGTQYNLAQRSPEFKRVFDGVQNFINDTSFYANEAANLAPKILPKLENWKDITKSPISAEDTKALSGPVFDGTLSYARDAAGRAVPVDELRAAADRIDAEQKARELFRGGRLSEQVLKMWQGLPADRFDAIISAKYEREMLKAGVVWNDDELRNQFGLSPAQVSLYREFRAATDKSLSSLAVSEMLNHAGGDVGSALRQQALDMGDHDRAAVLLRDHLFALGEADAARQAALDETANRMIEIADRATDLQKRGYAPLSRFGTYTLEATLPTGEHYFTLFETTRERAKMARTLAATGATGVKTGTMSQLDYKLLQGVSPETVALFGDMLGLESQGGDAKDIAFQTYIKKAVANRSALKRLLARKGTAGFSEDAGRVLAGFVYSNGRRTSSNLHSTEIADATAAMSKEGGELKDAAVKLADYVKNPQEEAQGLRGLLFAQYLGGSIASAMVNATQPFTVTFPYLSQFGGVTAAAKQMAAAVKVAGKAKTGDVVLDAALQKAEDDGIVSPQEIHQLQAQAAGRAVLSAGDGTKAGDLIAKGQNVKAKVQLAWGKVFGIAEQFNRRVTFIAAYRTAVEQGMPDPAAFAAKAVTETQFIYNKGNKPQWARGAIGGTLFTFKQYSVNYLELLHRMATAGAPGSPERAAGRKAALLAVAVLFLIGGADGLPFEGDAEDVLDGFMQRLGYNFSSRRAKNEFLASVLGDDMARFVNKGLSGLPGAPIDVSGRMGMGNLIPGTGLLTKKADHTSDVAELLGPAGDFAKRGFQAAGQVVDGKLGEAMATMSPVASRNVRKSVDMLQTGSYRDQSGRKVIDTSPAEAIMKAIGFQPNSVARVQEAASEVQQQVAMTQLRQTELVGDMAQAVYEKDAEKIESVRDALKRWNAANPEAPARINMATVLQKVKVMREDKATRIEKSAPRGMRAAVRQQLAEASQ